MVTAAQEPEELEEFRTQKTRWAALAVLAVGLALIVLDGTIVGVSMPTIINELNLDIAGAQWVTSSYSVIFAALLLAAGRAGDEFGRRTLFLVGLVVFVAGSAFAALSTSAGLLIAGLRASGAPEEITGQLAVVFAEAAKWSLYASVVALAIGLIAATVVRRKAAEQG
ncbi:MFS transporter [Corynebacterium senegalense]|uniref:MFS transporter n=1 Tax=Corynebacterium senegalense TaxID=2080750 RepID=UPI0024826D3A|nr:MFS transporter [Corynebacterium senegalense]